MWRMTHGEHAAERAAEEQIIDLVKRAKKSSYRERGSNRKQLQTLDVLAVVKNIHATEDVPVAWSARKNNSIQKAPEFKYCSETLTGPLCSATMKGQICPYSRWLLDHLASSCKHD